ncbi:MAG TPA: mandelate racemase, partial [bacterium]|nr:mandelate racemase [bacterium]
MKIERLEAFPVEYPTRGRFKFLEGPKGEPLGRRTVLVKMTADDGSVGWGESVPSNKWSYETVESVTTTLRNYLAPV